MIFNNDIIIYEQILTSDVDECFNNTHDCDEHAFCNDTDGSYNCTCLRGYRGDGFNCNSKQLTF